VVYKLLISRFGVGARVRSRPGYGSDWVGTVVQVEGTRVLVEWDHGPVLWNDDSERVPA
jgi:hypothetical protein